MRTLTLVSTLLLTALGLDSFAATYVVNPDGTGDFPTIQAAVDATVDGDIVELGDGTFVGSDNRDVDTLGRRITIRSAAGTPDLCTIDCEGSYYGVRVRNGSTLEDVTILHASRGVWVTDEAATISGVNVHGCGHGMFVGAGWRHYEISTSARIIDCVISGNGCSTVRGGGVHVKDDATFERCVISGNVARFGGGVFIEGGHGQVPATVSFSSCTITGNLAEAGGGVHTGMPQRTFQALLDLDHTILWGNFGADLSVHKPLDHVTLGCSAIDRNLVAGALEAVQYGSGNLYGDPLFCDPIAWEDVPTTGGDLTLYVTSPAANSPLCGLIGALGVGCGGTPAEIGPTAPSFVLGPVTPNPFRHETAIRWEVPRRVPVEIAVYDVSGRKIRTLVEETRGSGAGVERWSGRDDAGEHVAAGVYFVRMTVPGFERTHKVVRLP